MKHRKKFAGLERSSRWYTIVSRSLKHLLSFENLLYDIPTPFNSKSPDGEIFHPWLVRNTSVPFYNKEVNQLERNG